MKHMGIFSIVFLQLALLPQSLDAETLNRCEPMKLTKPRRIVYQCAGGMVLEAAAATALGVVQIGRGDQSSETSKKAFGVVVVSPNRSSPFQIRSPNAIAAVRGTVSINDATEGKTSISFRGDAVKMFLVDKANSDLPTSSLGESAALSKLFTSLQGRIEQVTNLLKSFWR